MKSQLNIGKLKLYGVLLVCALLLSASTTPVPPKFLKKDVKEVCSCFKDLVKMESKNFPKTSPYYQQARAKAVLALSQVEKHIQEKKYSQEEFNNRMKKKCPELVKQLQNLTAYSSNN